jgi:hypothetical protein
LLRAVAADCEVSGLEITAFDGPEDEAERSTLAARIAALAVAGLSLRGSAGAAQA